MTRGVVTRRSRTCRAAIALWLAASVGPPAARARAEQAPAPRRVAFVDLASQALDVGSLEALNARLREEIGRRPTVLLLPRSDLSLHEMQVAVGCHDMSSVCLTQIGQTLGAAEVLFARLGQGEGGELLLTLGRVDVIDAILVQAARAEARGPQELVERAAPKVVETLLGPAAEPAPVGEMVFDAPLDATPQPGAGMSFDEPAGEPAPTPGPGMVFDQALGEPAPTPGAGLVFDEPVAAPGASPAPAAEEDDGGLVFGAPADEVAPAPPPPPPPVYTVVPQDEQPQTAAALTPPPPLETRDDEGAGAPIWTRWWLWTGIGVLVAGGATTAALLLAGDDGGPGGQGLTEDRARVRVRLGFADRQGGP